MRRHAAPLALGVVFVGGAWACRPAPARAPAFHVVEPVPTSSTPDVAPEPAAETVGAETGSRADASGEVVEPTPAPDPIEMSGSLLPDHVEYPAARADEATCDRLSEAAIARIVPLSAPCETANDCIVVDSICPFGCWQVVSAGADLGPARAAVARYFRRCTPCKNTCLAPPAELACDEGRCVDPRLRPAE